MDWAAIGVIVGISVPALGGFGVLVGVIWRGQNQRVDGLEDEAREDRKHFSETADEIFGEIRTLSETMTEFRVKTAENYATKRELREHQENGHK